MIDAASIHITEDNQAICCEIASKANTRRRHGAYSYGPMALAKHNSAKLPATAGSDPQCWVREHRLIRIFALVREPDRGRNAGCHGTGRDVLDDHGVCADLHPVTDVHRSENPRSGTDGDVAADRRVALHMLHGAPTEGHAVIHQHIVTDLGGLADDHAHA